MLPLLGLIVGLTATTISQVRGECQPVFKEDAASLVSAGFASVIRRGAKTYDYKYIEVYYSPFLMVKDRSCIEESQLNLEVKVGNGEWMAVDSTPEAQGGGKYKWSIDAVPCKDHMIKIWVTGPGGSASLEFPEPILAAAEQDIINSRFTPAAPADLEVKNSGDNELEVSWQTSECATSYEISYGKDINSMQSKILPASQGSQIHLGSLTSCSRYDIHVTAFIGDNVYSDSTSVAFTTQPEVSSALQLEPVIDRDTSHVMAKWQAFDKLSCVDSYAVSVCKETADGCVDTQTVETNDALTSLKYEASSLDQCSDYTLQIKPLYPGMELDPKIVEFRTKSPAAVGAENGLMPVNAEASGGQMISVSWTAVQCAEFYEVFQQVNTGGDWEFVHKTSEAMANLAGVPCTEYRYGVSVTIDGVRSPIMEAASTVMTKLSNSEAFQAPNLEIMPTESGAELTWDHGACIPSYVVRVCSTQGDIMCEESTVIRDPTVHNITHEIDNLHACSAYSLEILPQIEGEMFEPDKDIFKTAFPAASPPEGVQAIHTKNFVELEWDQVECSSGYKLTQWDEETKVNKVVWETEDATELHTVVNGLEPCSTYRYGLAAIVGGEVSASTEIDPIAVPPRFGVRDRPTIQVLENVNDTVSFVFNKAASNSLCQVEYYQVRYSSLMSEDNEEKTIYPEDEAEKIIITFPGASGPGLHLEGRVKYMGHEAETQWIRSQEPQIQSNGIGSESSILVPIIIGILVGIVVLVIIVFFLVKKKREQNKYDAEKASSDKDETQKLNADMPESS
jgi:hypothetical protein